MRIIISSCRFLKSDELSLIATTKNLTALQNSHVILEYFGRFYFRKANNISPPFAKGDDLNMNLKHIEIINHAKLYATPFVAIIMQSMPSDDLSIANGDY